MLIACDQNKKNRLNLRPGFTFIELIIALTILAVLAITIVPNYLKYIERAKVTRTKETLAVLKGGIVDYYEDNSKYPNQLIDLIRKPADAKRWKQKYLDLNDVPEDGWGNPFIYRVNPKGSGQPYELYAEDDKGVKYSVWDLGTR